MLEVLRFFKYKLQRVKMLSFFGIIFFGHIKCVKECPESKRKKIAMLQSKEDTFSKKFLHPLVYNLCLIHHTIFSYNFPNLKPHTHLVKTLTAVKLDVPIILMLNVSGWSKYNISRVGCF